MNAVAIQSKPSSIARNSVTAVSQFKTLIKREFNEHRGSVLWAPLILAGIQVVITLITSLTAYFKFHNETGNITVNGQSMNFTLGEMGKVLSNVKPEDLQQAGKAMDMFYYAASLWPLLLAGIVAFFYCLGAVYDERKDRSLLFWKSMPISDTQTVASKAVMALLVIPGVAMLVSAALVLTYTLLAAIACLFVGISPMTILSHSSPLSVIGSIWAGLPLHALWALPAAGWLLMCSAFAKRVPILWAVGLPLLLGVIVLWIESGSSLGSSAALTEGYFHHVVAHILPGIVPGSFISELGPINIGEKLMPYSAPVLAEVYTLLFRPALWVGVLAGVAMLAVTVVQRRRSGAL